MRQWVAPATQMGSRGLAMVGFRLSEPKSLDGQWRLTYHLYAAADGERISAGQLLNPDPIAARIIAGMAAPQETLLEALGRCGNVFAPIGRSLSEKLPVQVVLDPQEAWDFLTRASLQLERAGYHVDVPAALSRVGHRRVRARMRIGSDDAPEMDREEQTGSGLLAGLVEYRWEACLGDDTLTAAEFMELAKSKAPLVHHRGQWVAVDPRDVARLQALIGEGGGAIDIAEALRLALSGAVDVPEAGGIQAEVVSDGQVLAAMEMLRDGLKSGPQETPIPRTLMADLRPYQERGFHWLTSVTGIGFGACLADDMGLGKTVQLITLLARIAEEKRGARFLVVCPTSVIGNWCREIRRFLPSMRSVVHHGATRADSLRDLKQRMNGSDKRAPTAVVTSYALARRDKDILAAFEFDCLVLDEAQNIKNPDAAQSKAVRHLVSARKVALTGTPVENRLTELWSIVDFLNPGLLGTRHAFKKQFAVPIERYGDEEAADLLRRVTAPFILRRLKTDPAIAPELPEKFETTRYCPLTREQAALYQNTVDNALEEITGLEVGIQRRGRILAMITAIKQICNHPAQYLRDGKEMPNRSGKLVRFLELFSEVQESDGHALIFTQYREMGKILKRVLAVRAGEEIPFLHGGLSRMQRERMVKDFQSPNGPAAMVVSLRAGGTGLNLTRANHVFHYDRWWNPAVEDQATDRAFRIGQTRDVTVHRMVSQGTMEEQIHQLLEDKRSLADRVVSAGETWLSEVDDDTLRSLMALGNDAVLED
ncbi:MAG: superfamily II DNA or RNA helicase [Myxococcota bacterium]